MLWLHLLPADWNKFNMSLVYIWGDNKKHFLDFGVKRNDNRNKHQPDCSAPCWRRRRFVARREAESCPAPAASDEPLLLGVQNVKHLQLSWRRWKCVADVNHPRTCDCVSLVTTSSTWSLSPRWDRSPGVSPLRLRGSSPVTLEEAEALLGPASSGAFTAGAGALMTSSMQVSIRSATMCILERKQRTARQEGG